MSNLSLYLVAVIIWSSTWSAIRLQLGSVPPAVSVVWRFALAALVLFAYAQWKRLSLRFTTREHLWLALQGLLMFGINYICVYFAELHLASGLVAVISSLSVFANILAMRVFFATPVKPAVLSGAMLGVAGVVLIFAPELMRVSAAGEALLGASLAIGSVAAGSIGNMAATRNHRSQIPLVQANLLAMGYGALFVALFAAAEGDSFAFDWSFRYVASLAYLALFGSVVAFGAYLTLMGRIGADRASYAAVAVPVLALVLSALFEDLRVTFAMVAGVALCLLGNLLVLSRGNA